MRSITALSAAVVAVVTAASGTASAQDTSSQAFHPHYVPAPSRALELTIGTGYTQGFGSLYQGVGLPSVINAGVAGDLGLGYRIDPHWMVGITGQYQQFDPQRAGEARGVTAGIQAAYHFAPTYRLDPWVQIGTGYRWLWEANDAPGTNITTQGLQAGRLVLGLDLRQSRAFAIAPVVGADIDVFLAQNGAAVPADARTSTFVYAGLQARFDVGGDEPESVARRDEPLTGVTNLQPADGPLFITPSISVSRDILRACKLTLGNPAEFGFDDSALTSDDHEVLDAVAACLTTGPLVGSRIRLVGRADPRGPAEYNMELGARRAGSVATYLGEKGVTGDRMEATSRGAMDARGYDEAGWANDRRVDIVLAR